MDFTAIASLGTEVGKVINNIIDRLPTFEQKKMEEFVKFEKAYQEEILRADSDTDDLVLWRYRRELLLNTIVKEIVNGLSKN